MPQFSVPGDFVTAVVGDFRVCENLGVGQSTDAIQPKPAINEGVGGFLPRCENNALLDRNTLSDAVLGNQHHAEACFALHHASVSISGLFERKCLDYRADICNHLTSRRLIDLTALRLHQTPYDW